MDHDQRFKTLIQEFFAPFLQLFFEAWAKRLDADSVQWLTQEVFPDPPEGRRGALDLVGKVATREAVPGQRPGEPEEWVALVHIEIESPERATPARARIFDAYAYLRNKYRLPVLPIVVFLKVGMDGVGIDVYEERFWEFRPLHFEYLYVGLPALEAVQYVRGENWLGVALAALMKIPKDRVAWLGAEALRRIKDAPLTEQQRFLLGECVQAYLPLDERQQREYEKLVATETYRGVQAMNVTWYEKGVEKGIEKGIEKGREQAQREMLRVLLDERFGPLPPQVQERLETMPGAQLSSLTRAVLRASSLRDLGLLD